MSIKSAVFKIVLFMKPVLFMIILFSTNIFSYKFGKDEGEKFGHTHGYIRGQVELVLDIQRVIGETIDNETDPQTYQPFRGVKDITLYIVNKNGVRTLAIWESQPSKVGEDSVKE